MTFLFKAVAIMALMVPTLASSQTSERFGQAGPRDIVQKATIFCIGPFGIGAETSKPELALCELLSESDAAQTLEGLLPGATPEGRMYLLYGLHRIDRPRYAHARIALLNDQGPAPRTFMRELQVAGGHIVTVDGCHLEARPKADVLSTIESGLYDRYVSRSCLRDASN